MNKHQRGPPCNYECANKYSSLLQIPWRVYCKKGCNSVGETWEECLEECDEICYKDPVLKDQQWTAYIDRSPGNEKHSEECFRSCISGCGYNFDKPPELADKIKANRPTKAQPEPKTAYLNPKQSLKTNLDLLHSQTL